MPMYETMLVTTATLDEEAGAALVGKFKSLIEANGTLDAVDEWGKRRLAYPINKEEEGIYTLFHYTSEADFPAELDRVFKITDGVLRSLIIVKDEVMENARLDAAAKKAEAEKAEAARAAARIEAEAKAKAEAEAAAKLAAEEAAAAPAEETPAEAEAPATETTEEETAVADAEEGAE